MNTALSGRVAAKRPAAGYRASTAWTRNAPRPCHTPDSPRTITTTAKATCRVRGDEGATMPKLAVAATSKRGMAGNRNRRNVQSGYGVYHRYINNTAAENISAKIDRRAATASSRRRNRNGAAKASRMNGVCVWRSHIGYCTRLVTKYRPA